MPDSRFYEDLDAVSVDELVEITGATLAPGSANGAMVFSSVAPPAFADKSAVTFFADPRYLDALKTTEAGACFVARAQADHAPSSCLRLLTSEPKIAYAKAAFRLHRPRTMPADFERVHPTATLEDGVVLAPGAVIGPGASIGAGTQIGANAVIGPGVAMGRDCVIGANVTIGFALIGDRVRILAGAAIGEAGFGVSASKGAAMDLPQLGRVILQDGVTVGANSCIDRGAWEDTVVGENTKIDNLVQIGHNVQLGRSCVLCGSVGLSGSTIVGDGVMFGAKAGVADYVTIGAGAQVMAAAGVMGDIPAGEIWGGAPAVRARTFWRQVAWVSRMAKARSRRVEVE
jgi:UDP-3-O-[3-hydroxymyristoyl] glucosamine N-acyltransferase